MFNISNDIGPSANVHQARAEKDALLAAAPFTYENASGETDTLGKDDYVRSADGTILKVALILVPTDYTVAYDTEQAKAFLESESDETFSEDIGENDWVHQSRKTTEELVAEKPFVSDVLSANEYAISKEGTLLICDIMLVPTDDTPEFDEEAANAFLAAATDEAGSNNDE